MGQAGPGPAQSSGPGLAQKRILVFWAEIGPTILGWVRPSRLGRTSPAHLILYIILYIYYILYYLYIYIYIYVYVYIWKNYKHYAKIIEKYMWFCCNFITVFWLILVGILYCKNTNPVLTYPVFIKTSKIFKIKKCLLLSKIF